MINYINSISFILKNNFFFLLLCIYPYALISGPFLSDIIVIVLTFYLIIKSIIEKNFKIYKKIYFYLFIIFCIYISFNSIFNSKDFISIKSSVPYFRFGFFALAVHFILENNSEKLKIFFYCLISIIFILSIDSIFQKVFGFNMIGMEINHEIRISSFFGDELILGSYVIKFLPITLAFIIYLKKEINLNFIFMILIVSLFPILLSAEKTAFLSFILFCIFIIFVMKYKFQVKLLLILTIFSLIFVVLSLNKNTKFRLIEVYARNMMDTNSIYTQVHLSHFKTAYKMYLDKPIYGHGPKMFRFKCSDAKYMYDEFSCSTHPHNFYLQLISETGLIGLSFLIYFYSYLIIMLSKAIRLKKFIITKEKLPYSIMVCSLLITFLPISTSGNIFNNWLSSINFFSIGILLFFIENIKIKN